MALFRRSTAVEALNDLLDAERQAILRGDLDPLVRIGPEKARLMQHLPGSTTDSAPVQRLREKAGRNQELLIAVARGVKNAVRRLDAMKTQDISLKTYDRSGTSHRMASKPQPSLEKRA